MTDVERMRAEMKRAFEGDGLLLAVGEVKGDIRIRKVDEHTVHVDINDFQQKEGGNITFGHFDLHV